MSTYDVGQEVRYIGTFADSDGTVYNPTTVRFLLVPPGQSGTYYTYPTGITRENTGTYYADVVLGAGGYWRYGWEGTGVLTTTAYGRDFARYPLKGGTL